MKKGKISFMSLMVALIGVALVGIGAAFNNCGGLGNDAVGIIYDGIRAVFGLDIRQLGMTSNIVNVTLIILLFVTGRKYVSIGTFVYLLPYGFFVDIGTRLYHAICMENTLGIRIILSVVGSLVLYLGIAIFITMDIGVDPFSGIALCLRDFVQKEFRIVKICFDMTLIVIGILLGGKAGIVTLLAALAAGPLIQFYSSKLSIIFFEKEEGELSYE